MDSVVPMAGEREGFPALGIVRNRRARLSRILRNIALGLMATIAGLWLLLYVTKGAFLKPLFERFASAQTQRVVTVDHGFELYFDPIDIRFAAQGLRISNPAWAPERDLLAAKSIVADIAPLSLLWGRRHFRSLALTDAAFDVEWNDAHTRNTWTFGTSEGRPLALPVIDTAILSGMTVRYRDPRMPLLADLRFQTVASSHARIGSAVHLQGSGRLRTTPFTLTGALLSPDATVTRGENRLTLEARAAGNVVNISGTLPSLADFEDVPLSVKARGKDIDDLLAIIGAIAPETRSYALNATMVKSGSDYRFTHLTGRFGDSDISGQFTVRDVAPRIRLDAVLATNSLDIIDAAPFIGYNPDTVAAKGAVAAAVETGAGAAHVLPNAPLPVQALKNFNASLHYTIRTVRSKHLPISNVDLTLTLENDVLRFKPLRLDMARGDLIADVTMDARREPVRTVYDVRLTPTPMARLFSGFGFTGSGTTGTIYGRLQLQGIGDTVHQSLASASGRIAIVIPSGTLSQRDVQLSELDFGVFAQRLLQHKLKEPVQINCGLVAFTVRHGIAAADPILIDTTGNVIAGRGNFDFGSEVIDLQLKADGKKFSLLSAQSPVGIRGHLSSPSVKVMSAALIGRAAVGVGLSIVATPFVGILAFVDRGGAKAAACGPVLSGATARDQRTANGKPLQDVGTGRASSKLHKKKFLGIF
jgi:uncharacterized protein involved in outer membrane biogenesis